MEYRAKHGQAKGLRRIISLRFFMRDDRTVRHQTAHAILTITGKFLARPFKPETLSCLFGELRQMQGRYAQCAGTFVIGLTVIADIRKCPAARIRSTLGANA